MPLSTVVGASNELPESEELAALYDRFLLRRSVEPVSDENVLALLAATTVVPPGASASSGSSGPLDLEAVIEEVTAVASSMPLSTDVAALLGEVRSFLKEDVEPPIVVSDRR